MDHDPNESVRLLEEHVSTLQKTNGSLKYECVKHKARQAEIENERQEAEKLAHIQEDALQSALEKLRGTLETVTAAEAVVGIDEPERKSRSIETPSLGNSEVQAAASQAPTLRNGTPPTSLSGKQSDSINELQASVEQSEFIIRERTQVVTSLLGQILDCQSAQLSAALALQRQAEHLSHLEIHRPSALSPQGSMTTQALFQSASAWRGGALSASMPTVARSGTRTPDFSVREGPVLKRSHSTLRPPNANSKLLLEASLAGSVAAQKQLSAAAFAALVATEGTRLASTELLGSSRVNLDAQKAVPSLPKVERIRQAADSTCRMTPQRSTRVIGADTMTQSSYEAWRSQSVTPRHSHEGVVHVPPRARSMTPPRPLIISPQPLTPLLQSVASQGHAAQIVQKSRGELDSGLSISSRGTAISDRPVRRNPFRR